MNERDIIQDRLHRKEGEVKALEDKLRSAKIYMSALQDILRSLDRSCEDVPVEQDGIVLKSGSSVAKAREAILRADKPMHVNDLLEAIGKGGSGEGRASLTGSLSAYVRRHEIFTRPAPNTFGLVELGHEDVAEPEPQPPRGFGRSTTSDDTDNIQ